MKRFFQMFLASLAIFLILAYIDEYENLISPFLKKGTEDRGTHLPASGDVKAFIQKFNDLISQAYLSAESSILRRLPADESIKEAIAEDIDFLAKDGRTMEISVEDIKVDGIERFSPSALRVKTTEIVSLVYRSLIDKRILVPKQVAKHRMVYMLEREDGRWVVFDYKTLEVEKLTS